MKWLLGLFLTVLIGIGIAIGLPFKQKDTLTWDAPTTNTDGTPLTDLAGYYVYYSQTSGAFTDANRKDVGNVRNVSIRTVIGPLNGTYYFVVTAYNVAKIESEFSIERSETFIKVPRPVTNTVIQ